MDAAAGRERQQEDAANYLKIYIDYCQKQAFDRLLSTTGVVVIERKRHAVLTAHHIFRSNEYDCT
jgi:hypothetical protein